jgi:hypothetical protein
LEGKRFARALVAVRGRINNDNALVLIQGKVQEEELDS